MEITKIELEPATKAEKAVKAENEFLAFLSKAVLTNNKVKEKSAAEIAKLAGDVNVVRVESALAGDRPLYWHELFSLLRAMNLELIVK